MFPKRPYDAGLALGAAALVGLALSACGGAATMAARPAATEAMLEQPDAAAPQAATEAAVLEAPAPALKSEGQNAAGPAGTPAPGQDNPLVAALPQDRLIIKNGEVTLLVQDTRSAVDQVTQIAVDNGGYILSNQSSLDPKGILSATLTIAVRGDQYETAMRRLREMAISVQSELSTGQDVTSEYVDLDSRLKNLEATRDRIKDFLAKAKSVDEALKVNQQLKDVEGEIEQVKGRMNYLSGRSAFSTITVNLNQKVDATPTPTPTLTPTPTPTPPWSISPTIEQATSAQVGLLRGLLQIAVWLVVVFGPYAVVIALGVWGWSRWYDRRRAARKAPNPPGEKKSS